MSADRRRRPTAFRLDEIELAEEEFPDEAPPPPIGDEALAAEFSTLPAAPPPRFHRRHRWTRLLIAAAFGLITLAFGLSIDSLVRTLFERGGWLGWVGVVLTALVVIALLALIARELLGLFRLRRIGSIQTLAADAVEADDREKAKKAAHELIELYRLRAETARGRTALSGHLREIIDGRDLVGLAETELLAPLDETARRMVMASAKRVSLVTAISPRALVDVLFVLTEILRLIRRLATLYGGRPGILGFIRLTRRAVGHLAVTGGMAAGESMIQQVLGHGLAARISTRLGEGVINGILTARVGIAAIDVCRPLPFVTGRGPRLSDIIAELRRKAPDNGEPG